MREFREMYNLTRSIYSYARTARLIAEPLWLRNTRKQKMKMHHSFGIWTALLAATLIAQSSIGQGSRGNHLPPGWARPPVHVRQRPNQPDASASPIGFTPAQIRQAYGFDQLSPSIDGTGQTIAIIDAFGDRYATTTTTGSGHHKTTTTTVTDATFSDWTNFCNQYGLSTGGLTVVYPQGQGNVDTNWALETALDIEWAHAIAPGAKIMLVVSKDNSDNLFSAVDYAVSNGATVVSMSWGGGEFTNELAYDQAHFNHPGVTFVASTGDGAEWSSGLEYPSASPYVLAVGGTQLTNDNGAWSETAWSGSGGGISLYESMPAWQNGWQQYPTGNLRSAPDVSYQGGPNPGVSVYVTPYGGWIQVYGTSVGSPQWAALVALANCARASDLVSASSALYSLAGSGATPPGVNASFLNDIVSGSDGGDPDDLAISGYDFVTGLGTPVAYNLVPFLAGATEDFVISASPSSESVAPGSAASYTVTITGSAPFNANNDGVSLSVSGLPGDATASFSPGSVTGSGSSTLTVSSATLGSYNLVITGTSGSLTHSITVGFTVQNPDFSLQVAPASVTVPTLTGLSPSWTANYNLTVDPLGGFADPVEFSASALALGWDASFAPNPASGSSILSITVPTSAPAGTTTLTLTGTDPNNPSLTHSVPASLVVASAPTLMTVNSISYAISHSSLIVTLTVIDNFGNPVANASVSITLNLNGAAYGSGTASTGSNGQASFQARNAPSGTYTTTVNSVTASGLTWNGKYPANSAQH